MEGLGPAVAQWIDAGGSLGTLIVAVVVLNLRERVKVLEAVQRRIERAQERRAVEERKHAQTNSPAPRRQHAPPFG